MTKSTKKSTTSLILASESPTPAALLTALDKLSAKVKHIEDSVYKVSDATLNILPGVKVQSETKIPNLIKAFSYVTKKEVAYNEAAKELGLDTFEPFKENDHPAAAWKADIRLRIDIINNKDTMDALKEMRAEAKSLMTDADRMSILMGKINKFAENITGE